MDYSRQYDRGSRDGGGGGSGSDDLARIRQKHQALLQQYLALQKDYVMKKRKLEAAWKKKDALLTQVRFLRGRRKLLLMNQVEHSERERDKLQRPLDVDLKHKDMYINFQVPPVASFIPNNNIRS